MWVVGGPGGCCAGDSHRRGPALARLIGRCLGKHPARRPSDADALLRELGSTSSRPPQRRGRQAAAPAPHLSFRSARAEASLRDACSRRSGDASHADRLGLLERDHARAELTELVAAPRGTRCQFTSLSTCKECNRRSPQLGGEEDHRARTATRSVVNEPLCFPKYCSSLSEPGECRTHTPSTEVVPYLRYDFSPRTEHVRKYCSRRCAGKGSMAARRATERAQREERARNRARSGAAA